jgi:ribosome-associated translation inhibitor RaiA
MPPWPPHTRSRSNFRWNQSEQNADATNETKTCHEKYMKQNNSIDTTDRTKINLLYRGINPRGVWELLVKAQIKKLQHLAAIASARITLERHTQFNPAFRVMAVLEVPGPDFHAEARDFTLRAALIKVADNLRRQMQSRKNRQIARKKHKLRFAFAGGSSVSRI